MKRGYEQADAKVLDQNTGFATRTALAFKNAYAEQKQSVLLDTCVFYRDQDNNIAFKIVSSALMTMLCDRFNNPTSNIIGLPIELNPDSINRVLAYLRKSF